MSTKKITQIVASLLGWFSTNARDLPWRRTQNPYAIWVSEIMLQQTQVKTVIPYWERWMQALPTIADAARAPSDQIHKLWEGLGYYTRVRNLQKAAQMIVTRHGGKFPESHAAVLELPGIGRYTAGAICSIAFNQPTPILDGNVIRVLTRLFAIGENPKDKAANARLWKLAEALVKQSVSGSTPAPGVAGRALASSNPAVRTPANGTAHSSGTIPPCGTAKARKTAPEAGALPIPRASFLNQSLMELGALICTPRNPQCLICPVQKQCEAFRQQRTEEFPNLGEPAAATAREFMAFVVEHRGHVLVRQRPAGVVNAHLWEFPNIEHTGEPADPMAVFAGLFGVKAPEISPFRTVKHSITRYRITLSAHQARLAKRPSTPAGDWVRLDRLAELAFTAAHKRLASAAARCILSDR